MIPITPDVLLSLGATPQPGGSWLLRIGGAHFAFRPVRDGVWDFDGHHASCLGECLAFAYRDGLRDGKDQLRDDLKELLGIE